MPALVVATVTPWQTSSPGGGLIHSSWSPATKLEPGMVIRYCGDWIPIIRLFCLTGQPPMFGDPVLYGEMLGLSGTSLWQCFTIAGGAEVRGDMRWDGVPIQPCGCWVTVDGTWTCDTHLRRQKAEREAARAPRSV